MRHGTSAGPLPRRTAPQCAARRFPSDPRTASGRRRLAEFLARRRGGAVQPGRHDPAGGHPRRPLHPAPVLAPGFSGAWLVPAVQRESQWQTRGRLHGAGIRRAGRRKRHRRAERAPQDAAADAVRRGQPFLPELREERQLPAAGHRLRDGHGRPALRGVLSEPPGGRQPPRHPARPEPLHPVRAVRARQPRCRWQECLCHRRPRHRRPPAGQQRQRPPGRHDDGAGRPRGPASARWA